MVHEDGTLILKLMGILQILFKANINADKIIPVYCFDPRHFQGTYHFGFPKTGMHRVKFLRECVEDLRSTLRKKGRYVY